MTISGYESIKDTPTSTLLTAIDEIKAELKERENARVDKKMSNFMEAVHALCDESGGYFRIETLTSDFYVNQIVKIWDEDRSVSVR